MGIRRADADAVEPDAVVPYKRGKAPTANKPPAKSKEDRDLFRNTYRREKKMSQRKLLYLIKLTQISNNYKKHTSLSFVLKFPRISVKFF